MQPREGQKMTHRQHRTRAASEASKFLQAFFSLIHATAHKTQKAKESRGGQALIFLTGQNAIFFTKSKSVTGKQCVGKINCSVHPNSNRILQISPEESGGYLQNKAQGKKREGGRNNRVDGQSFKVCAVYSKYFFLVFLLLCVCKASASLLHCASYKIDGNGLGDTGKALSDSLPFLQH